MYSNINFDETLIMSSDIKEYQFSCGVRIRLLEKQNEKGNMDFIYEITNPTNRMIRLNCSNGIIYDKNNNIADTLDCGFFHFNDLKFPIESLSRGLIPLYIRPYIPIENFGRFIQTIQLEDVTSEFEEEINIRVSRSEFFVNEWDFIQCGYITNISKFFSGNKEVYIRILLFDGYGNPTHQHTNILDEDDCEPGTSFHTIGGCVYLKHKQPTNKVVYIYSKD